MLVDLNFYRAPSQWTQQKAVCRSVTFYKTTAASTPAMYMSMLKKTWPSYLTVVAPQACLRASCWHIRTCWQIWYKMGMKCQLFYSTCPLAVLYDTCRLIHNILSSVFLCICLCLCFCIFFLLFCRHKDVKRLKSERAPQPHSTLSPASIPYVWHYDINAERHVLRSRDSCSAKIWTAQISSSNTET